ncbi:CTP synthase, partial [Enterococcus faecalis]
SLGENLLLGWRPGKWKKGTKIAAADGSEDVFQERHLHRYEFNNKYRQLFEENGLVFSGVSPDNRLFEIVEILEKQFFVACQ